MKAIFSGFVSFVLLVFYVYLVWHGVAVARCLSAEGCTSLAAGDFNDQMSASLALVGGLISALVIAELSITQPGEAPGARLVAGGESGRRRNALRLVTGLYLLVWLATGMSAFFFGYLIADEERMLQPLADLGQAWLGVAVGAAYAYFGIR